MEAIPFRVFETCRAIRGKTFVLDYEVEVELRPVRTRPAVLVHHDVVEPADAYKDHVSCMMQGIGFGVVQAVARRSYEIHVFVRRAVIPAVPFRSKDFVRPTADAFARALAAREATPT